MDGDSINSYRDLRVWQQSMDAAVTVLAACDEEPLSRKYRLAGQLEACAASIPANIAEGHASGSTKNYLKHLYIARGSLAESQTFVELFGRRGYLATPRVRSMMTSFDSIGRMLNALINSLAKKKAQGRKPQPDPAVRPPSPKP